MVEVQFYADDGDEILGTELDHFAALNFTAGTLATPVMLVDNHFAFDGPPRLEPARGPCSSAGATRPRPTT